MEKIKNYLPQNIKSLRMVYGESQMELAFAIGLNAPAAISNYENGTRSPKPEVRKKIAKHFRITEDQLMHTDLTEMRQISTEVWNDARRMQELAFVGFPVVCSDIAIKNVAFANGYNAHMRIKRCILSGKEPDEKDFDVCFESYEKAFDEDAIPEAAGNLLWLLLLFEYILLNQEISDGLQKLKKNKISGVEFFQQYYLKNFDFDDCVVGDEIDESDKKEKAELFDDVEETVQDLLKKIRSSRLSDLAYYYTAIRYMFGIVKNELSIEMNEAIGTEMIWAISMLGNKYAKNYIQAMLSAIN